MTISKHEESASTILDRIETSQVRQIRYWLESLAQLGLSSAKLNSDHELGDKPQILIVLDNDYGELTTLLYLVLGQPCFDKTRVLLSPRLYEKNRDALPARMQLWTTEQDLLDKMDELKPDLLILASAYLLPVHHLLSCAAIQRVCDAAAKMNVRVLTADPFLGLLSQCADTGIAKLISIDIPLNAGEQLANVKRQADEMLHRELAAAEKVLRPYSHLYPSFTDMQGLTTAHSDSRNTCFFNQSLLLPAELNVVQDDAQPHWMFVISEVDFQTQAMFLGAVRFTATVANLLTQTAQLGRKAIFLGPAPMIDLLRATLDPNISTNTSNIYLLNFCAFERVMALLLSAEYSFYWNVVSHSILMQLWNGRPVILFNKGHLARAIPSIYPRVIAWYYQGWEPPYISQDEPLSLAVLAEVVSAHATKRGELMQRYQRAPSPQKLLDSLLQ